MGEAQTQPTYPKGITFEQVWAALMEDREQMKESRKKFEQEMKEREQQREKDRIEHEQQREKDRIEHEQRREKDRIEREQQMKEHEQRMKAIDKRLGDFTNSFGEIVECMIAPNLQEKFNDFGYDFQEASTRHKVRDKKNDIRFEIDVFLQNGDTAMLVEIKADLTISDINRHIIRLEKMRKWADFRGDKRHFIGAVAGIVVEDDVREYALSQGFFLIEPSGENFNITPPHKEPKKW